MIYITIEEALFNPLSDEFLYAMAKTVDEACNLVEVAFGYVCDFDSIEVFKKRK